MASDSSLAMLSIHKDNVIIAYLNFEVITYLENTDNIEYNVIFLTEYLFIYLFVTN